MISSDGKVSFLIAGVQKSGTSALHAYLSDVPCLQLPQQKELHFFDNETEVNWLSPDYHLLHRHFSDDGRLWGEATPITLYWPKALERVRGYNPLMRLILMFRDPIERAYSHWKMEYARARESLPFEIAIREGRARMASSVPTAGFDRTMSYVERGFYGRQLSNVFRLFPREQILCIPHELLSQDPLRVIRDCCTFLEVDTPMRRLEKRMVREGKVMDYPSSLTERDVRFLQDQYKSEIERFKRQVDGSYDWSSF